MSVITQLGRAIQIRVDGIDNPDLLLATGLSGVESISSLFEFDVEFLHQKAVGPIQFQDLLGRQVSISVRTLGVQHRYFHGIITKLARTGDGRDFRSFLAKVAPALWRLTKKQHSRIYQDVSAPQILKEGFIGLTPNSPPILGEISTDWRWIDAAEFPVRNYCVQYRETDFNFASRLMEEEGVNYYFLHSATGHQMVLTVSRANYPKVENPIQWRGNDHHEMLEPGEIHEWQRTQDLASGRCSLSDYTFQLPDRTMNSSLPIIDSIELGHGDSSRPNRIQLALAGNQQDLEISDYPAGYAKYFDNVNSIGGERLLPSGESLGTALTHEGDRFLRLRMGEEESRTVQFTGTSIDLFLAAGHLFELEGHSEDRGEYLISRVEHSFTQPLVTSGTGPAFHYRNRITCVPASLPYLPSKHGSRRPQIHTQTAKVMGPEEGQVFTDRYGRIKVEFHWGTTPFPYSSCWLRVAQPWAGPGWGHQWIPRVGNEVLVDFLEGDPDQPIVAGSVYNENNLFPFRVSDGHGADKLAPRATRSGIKTHSIPNGRPNHSNELRFDDMAGHEQVFLHSQGRMDLRSQGTHYETAGGSREMRIGGETDGRRHGDNNTFVYRDENTHLKGVRYDLVEMDSYEINEGKTFRDFRDASTTFYRESAEIHAKRLKLEALEEICFLVGNHYILIDQQGIRIDGAVVSINCGGKVPKEIEDPDFLKPIDALPADTNTSSSDGSGSSVNRQHESYRIVLPHAPHTFRPPRRRPVIPPPPRLPDLPPGNPCTIRSLSVICSHRRSAVNQRLEVVQPGGDTDSVRIHVSADAPCAVHPRIHISGAVARTAQTGTVAMPVQALSPVHLWNAGCVPTTYRIAGECCHGSVPPVEVKAFPGRQVRYHATQWARGRAFLEWVVNTGLGTALEVLGGPELNLQLTNGEVNAELGWREHSNWQAYFGGRAQIALEPIVSLSVTFPVSLAAVVRIFRRLRRLGRWFGRIADAIERMTVGEVTLGISARVAGQAERLGPGPASVSGRLESRITLQLRIRAENVEFGSDSLFDARPHLSITFMTSASGSVRAEGPLSWDDEAGIGVNVHLRGTGSRPMAYVLIRGIGPLSQHILPRAEFGDREAARSENETFTLFEPVDLHRRWEIIGPNTIEL